MQNKIFFEIHPGGLFNQLLSIEVGLGLSKVYQKEIIFYNKYYTNDLPSIFSHPFDNNKNMFYTNKFPNIFDLLSTNITDTITFINNKVIINNLQDILKINNLNKYYYSDDNYSNLELKFAGKRKKIIIPKNESVNITTTLAQYSSFFFNRNTELDLLFSKIKFKDEYYEFAKEIVNSIGSFNGGHLRLTDNANQNATLEGVSKGIDNLNNQLPFIMCTDEPSHEFIVKNNKKIILLDRYILNNFKKEFDQLKFKDSVSFALLCNLVMHYSKDFIGSLKSTYTSYIQRNLNQSKLLKEWRFWNQDVFFSKGPFSWNNHVDEDSACWYREWPESFLN